MSISTVLTVADLKSKLEEARKWAEEFCQSSTYFDATLKGFAPLAARHIFKQLKPLISVQLIYINETGFQHVYCMAESFGEKYILDVAASIYGEETACVIKATEVDLQKKPWWRISQIYETEASLIKRLRKDGWPEHQITLPGAKKKKSKISFVEQGASDIDNGVIKILPFDNDEIKYLNKVAKSDGIKSNLAALMLVCDAKELKELTQLIIKYL